MKATNVWTANFLAGTAKAMMELLIASASGKFVPEEEYQLRRNFLVLAPKTVTILAEALTPSVVVKYRTLRELEKNVWSAFSTHEDRVAFVRTSFEPMIQVLELCADESSAANARRALSEKTADDIVQARDSAAAAAVAEPTTIHVLGLVHAGQRLVDYWRERALIAEREESQLLLAAKKRDYWRERALTAEREILSAKKRDY